MKVTVIVPDEYMGDVIGDLNCPPRPDPGSWKLVTGAQQIDALVPLSNMFGYATDLRSPYAGPRPVHDGAALVTAELPKNLQAQDHRTSAARQIDKKAIAFLPLFVVNYPHNS